MSGFSQKLEGSWGEFGKALEGAGKINFKKMHQQIGESMVANTQLRFKDQKGPDGKSWVKNQRGGQILNKAGHLSSSVTSLATKDQVEVGTNVIYALIHQNGGKIKAKNAKFLKFHTPKGWVQKKVVVIPARPFIGFDKSDELDIDAIWEKTMKGTVK